MPTDVDDGTAQTVTEALKSLAKLSDDSPESQRADLLAAGDFVFRYGELADWYEEPALTRMQFVPFLCALYLLGHWSVERGEPADDVPAGYTDHRERCRVCRFLEQVNELGGEFDDSPCGNCGHGPDEHAIDMADDGGALVNCLPGWDRLGAAAVLSDADLDDHQVGDAHCTRWVAVALGGLFAVVSRTYFHSEAASEVECLRRDDYVICRDPENVYDTLVEGATKTETVDSVDPAGEDTRSLAVYAPDPTDDEWRDNATEWSAGVLLVQGRED